MGDSIELHQISHLPSMVERRSAFSRYSSDALAALGRQRSVLAKRIPARAAPTAPKPSDHIPMSNSCPSNSDPVEDTAAQTGKSRVRDMHRSVTHFGTKGLVIHEAD